MNLESIIQPAVARAVELEEEITRVKREVIDPMQEELRTLNRILNAATPNPKSGKPSKKKSIVAGNRSTSADAANARYGVVTTAVTKLLMDRPDLEEFRGVDIRAILPETVEGIKVSSSNVAEAFNALRGEGYVRFVRKDGNSRYYGRTGDDPSPELLTRLGITA